MAKKYRIKHGKYAKRTLQKDGTVKSETFVKGDIVELSDATAANLIDMLEHPDAPPTIETPNPESVSANTPDPDPDPSLDDDDDDGLGSNEPEPDEE